MEKYMINDLFLYEFDKNIESSQDKPRKTKGEKLDCLGFQFNMWKRDKSTQYPLAAN